MLKCYYKILYICNMLDLFNTTYCNYLNIISEVETPEKCSLLNRSSSLLHRELLSPTLPQLIISSLKQKLDGNHFRLSMLQSSFINIIEMSVQCLYLTTCDLSNYLYMLVKLCSVNRLNIYRRAIR